jgi:hypothetical protein
MQEFGQKNDFLPSKVKGQKHGESTERVAAGPDEQGWKGEKCWTRREFLVAFLRLLVLYVV